MPFPLNSAMIVTPLILQVSNSVSYINSIRIGKVMLKNKKKNVSILLHFACWYRNTNGHFTTLIDCVG